MQQRVGAADDLLRQLPERGAVVFMVMKQAKLETGLVVNVPPFVSNGDKIKVDTTEARYIQRIQ